MSLHHKDIKIATETDTPSEYKLKVVNICKMHGMEGLELVVL